jgi:hypothetical protein
MSDDTHRALIKQRRADKYLRITVIAFFVYMMAVGTFSAIYTYKVQSTVAHNQKVNSQASEDRFSRYTAENARQHALTQQYVKCLFDTLRTALQKPFSDRTDADFDVCAVASNKTSATAQPKPQVSSITPKQTSGSQNINGTSTHPTATTSAPPDPTTVKQPSLLNTITSPVTGLLNGIQSRL